MVMSVVYALCSSLNAEKQVDCLQAVEGNQTVGRFYHNGYHFLVIFPDGSGSVLYPCVNCKTHVDLLLSSDWCCSSYLIV